VKFFRQERSRNVPGEGVVWGMYGKMPGENCLWECRDSHARLQVSTCSGYDFYATLVGAYTHTEREKERQREILAAYTIKT